jgi:hypothetical protein
MALILVDYKMIMGARVGAGGHHGALLIKHPDSRRAHQLLILLSWR